MIKKSIGVVLAAVTVLLAACADAPPRPVAALPPGQILAIEVTGDVHVQDHEGKLKPLMRGDLVDQGNTMITGEDGIVLLLFSNGVIVQLKPDSKLELTTFRQAPFDSQNGDDTFDRLDKDPSQSLTTLYLINGTLAAKVLPLDLDAGSVFTINTPPGAVSTFGSILQVQVACDNTGNFSSANVAVAQGAAEFDVKLNTMRAPSRVQIQAGGQLKILHYIVESNDGYPMFGSAFIGNQAAEVINNLYVAMNSIITNHLPPKPPPAPPTVPRPPNTMIVPRRTYLTPQIFGNPPFPKTLEY